MKNFAPRSDCRLRGPGPKGCSLNLTRHRSAFFWNWKGRRAPSIEQRRLWASKLRTTFSQTIWFFIGSIAGTTESVPFICCSQNEELRSDHVLRFFSRQSLFFLDNALCEGLSLHTE